ncbi:MAG: DUF2779 domain-containing protein [Gemmatimonadales bacterium]|nr:DUF2779 domain-containing protein [Gemmatimonadales bacterium]
MPIYISKSKYISGLQCPKLLWTQYNDKNAIPAPDAATEAIFAIGHSVGDLAKELYPDGIEVPWSRNLEETTAATMDLLPQRKPIFEASFQIDGCYCRADIMVPVGDDSWDLYEVKSATKVKDVNVADIAFQTHAIERSGIKLDRLYLMHIDNRYVRQGEIDPAGLFHAEDVTKRARALQPGVAANVAALHRTIDGPCPDIAIGEHCTNPYSCDLWEHCSAFLPEHSVLQLYRIHKKKAFRMLADGIAAIADAPAAELSNGQLIQQAAVNSGQPYVSQDAIRRWLAGLQYPVHCFDFETMNPAVPLFDGTSPYRQVPFQFSLHIIDSPGKEPRHFEFLAEAPEDPRPALIDALKNLGDDGTILAYNMGFERGIISRLAEDFPAEAVFLRSLNKRFLDLMTPFSSFWYHDPKQKGSCSLKNVLPVLTDTSYDGIAIAEGGQAQREFQRAVFTDVAAEEKAQVLQDLRAYCKQDTQALVDVLGVLQGLV